MYYKNSNPVKEVQFMKKKQQIIKIIQIQFVQNIRYLNKTYQVFSLIRQLGHKRRYTVLIFIQSNIDNCFN